MEEKKKRGRPRGRKSQAEYSKVARKKYDPLTYLNDPSVRISKIKQNMESSSERYNKMIDDCLEKRTTAAKMLKARIFELGFSLRDLSHLLDIDIGQLSRQIFIRDNDIEHVKALSMGLNQTVIAGYKIMNMSIHEFLFQEKVPTTLMKGDSVICRILDSMDDFELYETIVKLQPIYSRLKSEGHLFDPDMSSDKYLNTQLRLIADDSYTEPESVCGYISHMVIRRAIRNILEENQSSRKSLNTYMIIAILLDNSIDFLLSPTFYLHTDLQYKYNNQLHLINKPSVLTILHMYLSLVPEVRWEFYTKILEIGSEMDKNIFD